MVGHRGAWLSPDVPQLKLIDMPIQQNILCFAPSGAGKTMLGVQRAKNYIENSLTVAMCSPTRLLAKALRAEFAEQGMDVSKVRVKTFEDVFVNGH